MKPRSRDSFHSRRHWKQYEAEFAALKVQFAREALPVTATAAEKQAAVAGGFARLLALTTLYVLQSPADSNKTTRLIAEPGVAVQVFTCALDKCARDPVVRANLIKQPQVRHWLLVLYGLASGDLPEAEWPFWERLREEMETL
jgi:hypothetical protein